jgi:cell wall-associated NlpC family hydrolase
MQPKPTGADVIAEARKCLGTPFRHQGRSRGLGLDCGGLLIVVGNALKLAPWEHFNVVGYGRYPQETEVRTALASAMDRIFDWQQVRPGDVIVVADPNGGRAVHMGIVAQDEHGRRTMIHATAQSRKVVEHLLDEFWHKHLCSAWRFRGLEEE